jgi:hypothetical protein
MTSRQLSPFPACGIVQQKGLLLMPLVSWPAARYCVQGAPGVSPTIRSLQKHNMTGKRAYVLAAEVDQNDPCENQMNVLFELPTAEPAMPDSLIARLWTGLLATSPLEALAVLSRLVYVVLAVPRSR